MKKSLILFLLLSLGAVMRANGDPVAERSALTLARTPMAVHVPEVKLLDEQCRFALHDGYTEVEVRYLLHNRSQRDFKSLPYGFPVDWLGEGPAHWESLNFVSESIVERGWRDSYVRDVMFSLDGRSLAWRCSADTVLKPSVPYIDEFLLMETGEDIDYEDPLLRPDSADGNYSAERTRQILAKFGDKGSGFVVHTPALCRRWYYVHLDLPAGKVVELKVYYRIENATGQGIYEELGPFRATGYNGCTFQYDFAPAAYWGDGLAQHFRVEVDTTDVLWQPVYKSHGSVEVKGLAMHKGGKGRLYEARNFDLAAAEPLTVSYSTSRTHEDLTYVLNHRIGPDRYTVVVSGADPEYPVAHLSDFDLGTATVLRPDKHDSLYITIRFRDSVMLTGVLLYNGYCKDRQTWLNNSRIDTLDYLVHTRQWDNKPYVERRQIFHPNTNWDEALHGGTPADFTWQGLTDAAMKLPVANRWMDYDFPWEWKDFRQKTKEITIRIAAVKPGRKYNDLCVSEIILIGD